MAAQRLRRPCKHDRYDEHLVQGLNPPTFTCPGGEFLPGLAQLPETCGTCGGSKFVHAAATVPCPSCHGSGRVYPAELVERLQKLIWDIPQGSIAVAVLDALNGETP